MTYEHTSSQGSKVTEIEISKEHNEKFNPQHKSRHSLGYAKQKLSLFVWISVLYLRPWFSRPRRIKVQERWFTLGRTIAPSAGNMALFCCCQSWFLQPGAAKHTYYVIWGYLTGLDAGDLGSNSHWVEILSAHYFDDDKCVQLSMYL